ncbi:MAG: FHA domain-containing protein [Acidobacteriota bacterium]
MTSDSISGHSFRLRDYRYPGEVVSLVLTFVILITVYTLAAIYLSSTWDQVSKALLITLLGLGVYIVTVMVQQRTAFGTLVRIGPRQFPELYERAQHAAECLSSPAVPVYVKRSSEMNIYTLGLWRRPIIVVTSSLVDQMDLDNLQFFIGREIGHIEAGHTWLRTLLKPVGSEVPVIGKLLNSVVFGDWINRTEYTADRAGFVACRSLTTSVSTMLKFGVGIRLFEKLDISEFLNQLNEVRNVRGLMTEIVAEQPYLTKRIRALVGFALSEKFQSLVPERRTQSQILAALPAGFLTTAQIKRAGVQLLEDDTHSNEAPLATVEPGDPLGVTQGTLLDAVADGELQLQLVTVDTGQTHPLRTGRTRIGRNRDNDVVLNSDRASRYHAEILRTEERIIILDHGSRNGVWLNGWRISGSAEVKPGDLIRIGKQEFTVSAKENQNDRHSR